MHDCSKYIKRMMRWDLGVWDHGIRFLVRFKEATVMMLLLLPLPFMAPFIPTPASVHALSPCRVPYIAAAALNMTERCLRPDRAQKFMAVAERMGEITGGNGNERRQEEERRGMIQFGEERKTDRIESILPLPRVPCPCKQQRE